MRLDHPAPVLIDEDVWPEFADAIRTIGERWTSPGGRTYSLELSGRRLQIDLLLEHLGPHPSGDQIDADLLELACMVLDAVGGEWSGAALRQLADRWGEPPPVRPDPTRIDG